jgi:hypothetical protein
MENGVRNLTLVGSPFLYLADAEGIGATTPKPAGTVVYPFHSTERFSITASHERLADEIAEREAGRRVTVVLYWTDHTPVTARIYEDRGFAVTCHGRRSDPVFLHRLLAVMADHDRVVSNRCGTALWYGAHLGLSVEIYGPYFGEDYLGALDRRVERYEHEQWPELHRGPVGGADALALGAEELGLAHQRSAEELRDLLGPPVDTFGRRATAKLALLEHQVRRVTVRGLGSIPPLAALDAVPLPTDLPEVDQPDDRPLVVAP